MTTVDIKEWTQSLLAVLVVGGGGYALTFSSSVHADLIAGVIGAVIGFYFGRVAFESGQSNGSTK